MAHSGIDRRHFDTSIRPQDDLYGYVNGGWLGTFAIPEDRAVDGVFRELYDRAEEQVRAIVEEAAADGEEPHASHERRMVGRLYRAFMAAEAIEELGADAIADELELIWAADSRAELAQTMGQLQRSGVGGVAGVWIDTDPGDPQRYVVNLAQGGLGLPDESYYREEQYEPIRSAYLTHIASMFALVDPDDPEPTPVQAAETIMALETKLAECHWDVVASRDETATYNLTTLADLSAATAGFAWDRWAHGVGAPDGALAEVIVRQPDFFQRLATLWLDEDLSTWKLWLTWHTIHARAPFLSAAIVEENFAFYGRQLTGAPQMRERWKRGVSVVESALGEAVGKIYTERHFPAQSKSQVRALVDNLVEAYRASIQDLEWMSSATKDKALAKLDKFTAKIGYPDRWRDYSTLQVHDQDLLGSIRAAAAFETDRELAKLGGPVDRDEWFMTPQTVNAYYNPGMNEIVFPAAILQPPFFDPNADDAANYGGIGAVIGHEIGHGFDDQGSKYDGDGRLNDWWTEADREEFNARTAALIAQYDHYVPTGLPAESHVNGALTIGENIGDLGGLSIAIKAYLLSVGGQPAPEIEGWSALQRLFLGWSQVWRTAIRDAEASRRLAIDPHSPAEFRCNGVVRNIEHFYQAFDVKPEDKLYLDPDQRVSIW